MNKDKPVIETLNLTKYYGKVRGIENVNLSIRKGEIFGFIGPNGAGKSTTIRTLLGLMYPTRGKGSIFGMDMVKESREIKKKIGFMPSEVNYYGTMNTLELLEYSAGFYKVDCADKIRELAQLFNVDLSKKIYDLSLGNKKKISILQSLIHGPELLILDEPTTGLDPLMQARFFEVLSDENKKGTTIFFSSHTLSEVQKLCKRVAIIKAGEIINVEDIETLRKKQLKKVRISIESKSTIDSIIKTNIFNTSGIVSLKTTDNSIQFMFAGSPNELVTLLAGLPMTDLVIEEPELEEIFMHYYEDGNEE
ncbi:MAG: ABC transporter ATP-binding protein [Spirochaetales bacterium]|nr:ABC transporter ATP-binding protein [Spirochaetales bacterium]